MTVISFCCLGANRRQNRNKCRWPINRRVIAIVKSDVLNQVTPAMNDIDDRRRFCFVTMSNKSLVAFFYDPCFWNGRLLFAIATFTVVVVREVWGFRPPSGTLVLPILQEVPLVRYFTILSGVLGVRSVLNAVPKAVDRGRVSRYWQNPATDGSTRVNRTVVQSAKMRWFEAHRRQKSSFYWRVTFEGILWRWQLGKVVKVTDVMATL